MNKMLRRFPSLLLVVLVLLGLQPGAFAQDSKEQPLPLFYKKLELLDTNRHRTLGVARDLTDFSYARQTDFIPIAASELSFSARHYPLVFVSEAADATPTLVAMVGLGDNLNLFVDAKGRWRAGAYIPAWVRRYPFITVKTEDNRDAVAFDPDAAIFKAKDTVALFENDKPTAALENILSFQNEFNAAFSQTVSMAKALKEAGVLEPSSLRIGSADKDKPQRTIGGFLVVNEAKLRALDAAALMKLQEANALGLAYAQMLSLSNLQSLTAGASGAAAPAAQAVASSKANTGATVTANEGFFVQIGSYADPDVATRIKTRLESGGHKVSVVTVKVANGSSRHQVRVGPFETRERANEVRDRAKSQGYDAAVLEGQ